MKKILLALVMFGSFQLGMSQKRNGWSLHNGTYEGLKDKGVARKTFPTEFQLFDLDLQAVRHELFKVVDNRESHTVVISIPNADGQMEEFEMVESSNFEPELQNRFPEIRAFSGRGITDKGALLKMSYSPQGIQTMVFRLNGKPSEFIEPYSADHHTYAVFKRSSRSGNMSWVCSTPDENLTLGLNDQVNRISNTARNTGDLKTMRLAQSVNAEYSNFFGATSAAQVNLVLAAVNATLTRCNGCYEKDLAIHLNLIANTTSVFYYNPSTDPYTNMNSWNTQLQNTLTATIGEANYDIGHLFGASGGGGNAGCIGCVCVNGTKGRGITSPADAIPQGDNFDIDYVVHEVGHQMGGTHSFSMSLESSNTNKEVGSGITIMGYAGITSQDVAPHSIAIYHATNIQQIQTNMAGKTCPITTSLTGTNATPVVSAVSNFTVPKSTPFALTGVATDADATDVLTYCWEQDDNSTTSGNASFASATKTTGPNWITWMPTTSPIRYFPKLDRILTGQLFTPALPGGATGTSANIEYLSSVARTLKFRLTVRDNAPYSSTAPVRVGQTQFTDMTVTVNATTGPFAVTGLDGAGNSWPAGSTKTITWSVNNTTAAPINCSNVNILLSTDGGQTFPITLLANTPNDGTQDITVPTNLTTTGRIKVEAVGNIFFDINNANISITAPPTGFLFTPSAGTTVACAAAATATANLATTANGGFSTPINLTATGNPVGTTVSFSSNPLTPGSSTDVILNNTISLAPGTYNISVNGVAGTTTQNTVVSFIVSPGTPPAITTQPANVSLCAGNPATFSAPTSSVGVNHQWQQSTDGGTTWTDIIGANLPDYTIASVLSTMNNLKVRSVLSTQCASSTSSAATLSVTVATAITAQPTDVTICANNAVTFTSTATGVGVSFQWQKSTDGGITWNDISGANTNTLTLDANAVTISISNTKYRMVATVTGGTCPGSLNSNEASLVVNAVPVVTSSTTASNVCSGGSVTLTAGGADTYSWAPITQTGSSVNITPTVNPSDPGTPVTVNYTVTGTTTAGCANTSSVSVTANPLPVVTISNNLSSNNLTPSTPCILTATATPTSTLTTYQWYLNGSAIPGAISSTITADVNHLGGYQCEVKINGNCANTSNVITLRDSLSKQIFITPNPNNGIFQVLYNSRELGLGNPMTIIVYDARGSRVYQKTYAPNTPFGAMNVWMANCAKGLYYLDLMDGAGNRLASSKVIINP